VKIIAIDISYKKPIAYCVLSEKGKLITVQSVEPANDIYTTSTRVLDTIIPYGRCLVISETPLIIHNMNTAFMMVRMHSMLEKGIRDSGGLFFGIHPLTWQKAILRPQKGDDRKALSIKVAGIDGLTTTDNDQADAFNIATYAFLNKKAILKAMRGGGKFSEK